MIDLSTCIIVNIRTNSRTRERCFKLLHMPSGRIGFLYEHHMSFCFANLLARTFCKQRWTMVVEQSLTPGGDLVCKWEERQKALKRLQWLDVLEALAAARRREREAYVKLRENTNHD